MKRQILDREHPEYRRDLINRHKALFLGGMCFKEHASLFLKQKPFEPAELYADRLFNSFYTNYYGNVITQIANSLFEKMPQLGYPRDVWKELFVNQTQDQVVLLLKQQFIDYCNYGIGHLYYDAERKILKQIPYANVIDWGYNESFVKTKCCEYLNQDWQAEATKSDVYELFTGSGYQKYAATDKDIKLIDSTSFNTLYNPIFTMNYGDELWIGNILRLVQEELIRADNGLALKESYCNFPQLVVKQDVPLDQPVGERYAVQLPKDGELLWVEPSGGTMTTSLNRIQYLKEELFRLVSNMSSSYTLSKSQIRQTGVAKREDKRELETLLKTYGLLTRVQFQTMLNTISQIHGFDPSWDVSGLSEFKLVTVSDIISETKALQELDIPSDTLYKTTYSDLAKLVLEEHNSSLINEAVSEIQSSTLPEKEQTESTRPDSSKETDNG